MVFPGILDPPGLAYDLINLSLMTTRGQRVYDGGPELVRAAHTAVCPTERQSEAAAPVIHPNVSLVCLWVEQLIIDFSETRDPLRAC